MAKTCIGMSVFVVFILLYLRSLNFEFVVRAAINFRKILAEVLHNRRPLQIYHSEALVLILSKSDEQTYLHCKRNAKGKKPYAKQNELQIIFGNIKWRTPVVLTALTESPYLLHLSN